MKDENINLFLKKKHKREERTPVEFENAEA